MEERVRIGFRFKILLTGGKESFLVLRTQNRQHEQLTFRKSSPFGFVILSIILYGYLEEVGGIGNLYAEVS